MTEQTFIANKENLDQVSAFVCGQLEAWRCSMKARMQLELAVEELFVNIASYAYPDTTKSLERIAVVQMQLLPEQLVEITFRDRGIPYDPLKRSDPDITKKADDREIGGLGIFIVKKSMDHMWYCYEDGWNILRIQKKIS